MRCRSVSPANADKGTMQRITKCPNSNAKRSCQCKLTYPVDTNASHKIDVIVPCGVTTNCKASPCHIVNFCTVTCKRCSAYRVVRKLRRDVRHQQSYEIWGCRASLCEHAMQTFKTCTSARLAHVSREKMCKQAGELTVCKANSDSSNLAAMSS